MTEELRCWHTGRETDKAVRISRIPFERQPTEDDFIWVPKSIIEGTTTWKSESLGGWKLMVLKLPSWWVDKTFQ
jgi:hypothetical protein